MNILFLSLTSFGHINERGLYSDLLREFIKNGHSVYAVSPTERRNNEETHIICDDNFKMLKVKTGNIRKTNLIEKGITTLFLSDVLKKAIITNFAGIKFDLILYTTPPITFNSLVKYIKHRDSARTYLLLKDIFPQNAVDLGMMSKIGIKSIIYWLFRFKEKQLYKISDKIGCMSQANVDYLLAHNRYIPAEKVEICPNAIEVQNISNAIETRVAFREKYELPQNKIIFVYGGNLGKPQGISFVIDCLRAERESKDSYFLIVGDGTEYSKLEDFVNEEMPLNVKLLKRLPKEDFDNMLLACDVGMIFLDYRFTIPNFPSRLLSYMQASLPVLSCTDNNTDVGRIIVESGFGWQCKSDSVDNFVKTVDAICNYNEAGLEQMKINSFEQLSNYSVEKAYKIIIDSISS